MTPNTLPGNQTELTRKKIKWVVSAIQLLSFAYCIWVLWYVTEPILRADYFKAVVERGWHIPMAQVNDWQLVAFSLIDTVEWLFLCTAVFYCWKALAMLKGTSINYISLSQSLRIGAWFAVLTQVIALLDRPLKSLCMSWHLEDSQHLVRWSFYPNDLLLFLLCFTLLGFAYVMTWTAEISEENKGFI
jgi:hypothetical protein